MRQQRELAPCLIGTGTVSELRDMVRALETVETFEYAYVVDGQPMNTGRATLVKIMADPDSSTMLVNGCLFLNVASFRYLTFEEVSADETVFTLVGDGVTLEMRVTEEPQQREQRAMSRIMEESYDIALRARFDDDEDDDPPL
ncbi:MAG: hypothetical protein N3B11_04595 [Coriobacteriia bacterium]|nr:hypothetical protein [Coriobacteriia bacterium]